MKFLAGTRWFSWTRLAGVMVTAGLLSLIFQKTEFHTLLSTLGRARLPWLLLAFSLYGVALFLGGIRWHLALRLTDCPVHGGAACRLLVIGHFFYVVLFGAAGGDVAKSMLYARWYRFGLPEVLAAVPLDRGLGTVAAVMVVCVALGLTFGAGGFHDWQEVEWTSVQNGAMVVLFLALALAILLLFWRPPAGHPWRRGWQAFWSGTRRLCQNPVFGRKALGMALLYQVATHAVFALNLEAVSEHPLPWMALSWTMPAITILSAFPITFAGAGVREVVSVTLLGLYGIPAGDAVAAAMLTLLIRLGWSAVGGVVYWREETLQEAQANLNLPQSISVVIPTRNEAALLPERVRQARALPEVKEIIVVDGGSQDATPAIAAGLGCSVVHGPPSRGAQLRLGAARATGDVVLFLHADTALPPEAGRALLFCLRDATVVGGGFWKVFDHPPLLLRGSRLRCGVRLWFWRRLAGDQALFVRRATLESVGGVPSVPLMEEFELCRRLRGRGRLALAGATVTTSVRRFREQGVWRTYFRMGKIHLYYRLGVSFETLRRIYDGESPSGPVPPGPSCDP